MNYIININFKTVPTTMPSNNLIISIIINGYKILLIIPQCILHCHYVIGSMEIHTLKILNIVYLLGTTINF